MQYDFLYSFSSNFEFVTFWESQNWDQINRFRINIYFFSRLLNNLNYHSLSNNDPLYYELLFQMPVNELVRPGFIYVPNFLTEAESKNLELNATRFGRWISLKNRRVQKG